MNEEITKLRRRQVKLVMPLIGPLIDAWDQMPNDVKGIVEEQAETLSLAVFSIMEAMEGHYYSDPGTIDSRSPWQIAEGRYGLPQEFRLGQRVRFRQGYLMPDWASDWDGVDLVVTGAYANRRGGAVEYWVNEVGSRDGDTTDVKAEWLEAAPNA